MIPNMDLGFRVCAMAMVRQKLHKIEECHGYGETKASQDRRNAMEELLLPWPWMILNMDLGFFDLGFRVCALAMVRQKLQKIEECHGYGETKASKERRNKEEKVPR
jgi:hypothetical protein